MAAFTVLRVGIEIAVVKGVKKTKLQMAKWARHEQARKIRAEWRVRFLGHTRAVFVLLFFAAIWVFVFNHQMQVQSLTSAELHKITNKAKLSDDLRQKALEYENQVNQINK